MIVADCSLLAYLLIEGEHTARAEEVLRRDPSWCAPFLWRSEFRNVLVSHIRHRSLPLEEARAKMAEAEELLGVRSLAVNSSQVLEDAAFRKISAYDAEYLALAATLHVPLVTFDHKLLAAGQGVAVSAEDFLSLP